MGSTRGHATLATEYDLGKDGLCSNNSDIKRGKLQKDGLWPSIPHHQIMMEEN